MPITPGSLPLKLITGITFGPVILTAKDQNNNPVDLTGWKVFAEVRKRPGATLYLDLQPSFTNITGGEITIPVMTDEATYNLNPGEYNWDLILEDPLGARRGPYIRGPFEIIAIITKPAEGL